MKTSSLYEKYADSLKMLRTAKPGTKFELFGSECIINNGYLYAGEKGRLKFEKSPWDPRFHVASGYDFMGGLPKIGKPSQCERGSADSCAFGKQSFGGGGGEPNKVQFQLLAVYAKAWGVYHPRPAMCYITANEWQNGTIDEVLAILKERGFQQVAQTKSSHANYQVYCLWHPGGETPTKLVTGLPEGGEPSVAEIKEPTKKKKSRAPRRKSKAAAEVKDVEKSERRSA